MTLSVTNHPTIDTFGARVRAARESRCPRMTQEALARQAGTGVRHLQRIETGAVAMPNAGLAARIAGALGVPVADLIP